MGVEIIKTGDDEEYQFDFQYGDKPFSGGIEISAGLPGLFQALEMFALDRAFAPFKTEVNGITNYFGNFAKFSKTFSIDTQDPKLISLLDALIAENRQRDDYQDQPPNDYEILASAGYRTQLAETVGFGLLYDVIDVATEAVVHRDQSAGAVKALVDELREGKISEVKNKVMSTKNQGKKGENQPVFS